MGNFCPSPPPKKKPKKKRIVALILIIGLDCDHNKWRDHIYWQHMVSCTVSDEIYVNLLEIPTFALASFEGNQFCIKAL